MKQFRLLTIIAMFLVVATSAFAGSWSGHVVDEGTTNGVENVTVEAKLTSVVNSTLTNSTGNFKVEGLGDGSYNLTFSKVGYVSKEILLSPKINNSNASRTNLTWPFNIELTKALSGTISGVVSNSTNGSVSGATVNLIQGGTIVNTTTTNSTGGYSLGAVDGTYTIQVVVGSQTQNLTNVAVQPNQTTSTSFVMTLATCTQSDVPGSWSSCSGSTQSRTITHYDTSGTCGLTTYTTESQSCSSGSSGGPSGDKRNTGSYDAVIPTIKTFNADVQNPAKYTMNGFDSLILTFKDVKYTLKLIQVQPGKATLGLMPTNQQLTGEKENVLTFKLNENDSLQVTILDMTYSQSSPQHSTVSLNVYLEAKKEENIVQQVVQQVVEKVKEAIVNVVGVVAPKENVSVAVGASISTAIVAIGLIIFFVVRSVMRPKF